MTDDPGLKTLMSLLKMNEDGKRTSEDKRMVFSQSKVESQIKKDSQTKDDDKSTMSGSAYLPPTLADSLRSHFQQVVAKADTGERILGMSTGYEHIDAKTAGLHSGDLVVVAARPGVGKTAFALNIAMNVASPRTLISGTEEHHEPGYGVGIFSPAVSREQVAMRMVCSEGRVDVGRLKQGYLAPDDWKRLTEAAEYLSSLPIWIDDTPELGISELRAKIRRLQAEYDRDATGASKSRRVGLVVVDYIQFMKGRDGVQNREEQLSELSRQLKVTARDCGVAMMAVSTLNRGAEMRTSRDRRPQLTDLRGSGTIEDEADVVIFIHRDEYYCPETTNARGLAEINIAKQRNGPTGRVILRFASPCARFDNLAPGDYPEAEDY